MAPIAHQKHPVAWQTRLVGGLKRRVEEGRLGDEALGLRIAELPGQLVDGVGRVGGAGDAAGPVQAEVDDGGVDAVGGEEGEDVALGPAEQVLEALAEADGMGLDLGAGVGAAGVAVYEEGWGMSVNSRMEVNMRESYRGH